MVEEGMILVVMKTIITKMVVPPVLMEIVTMIVLLVLMKIIELIAMIIPQEVITIIVITIAIIIIPMITLLVLMIIPPAPIKEIQVMKVVEEEAVLQEGVINKLEKN